MWQRVTPHFFDSDPRFGLFHDFNKRIAAIRELFEECNLLTATSQVNNVGGKREVATLAKLEG